MAEIVTRPAGERAFDVDVTVRGDRHQYRITVPEGLPERLGADPAEVARATFAFLLDREPPAAIMRRFDCSVVSRFFPEYERELPRYLEGPGS